MKNIIFLSLIIFPIVFIVLAFAGTLKLLGAQYDHPMSLILFYIIYLIIDLTLDSLSQLVFHKDNTLTLFLESLLSIFLTDVLLSSVTLTFPIIVFFAGILTLVEKVLDYSTEYDDE